MDETAGDARLSQLPTLWSQVLDAHAEGEQAARGQLLARYDGAVRRYLLAAVRDPHAAGDLAQEFALRFLRGDFRRADPGRGRFRDYLKTALGNLVVDHFRRQKTVPAPLPSGSFGPVDAGAGEDDAAFRESWRAALLERAWEALARDEQETGRPLHTVLKLRAANPAMSSPELADAAGQTLGKAVTPAGVRQTLHRARERFADLLLGVVADSLDRPTAGRLEEELVEVGLLEYCRPALARWPGGG
jgi:RNA polymerase sigma-70 factor (ECF subfamily)